MKISNKPQLIVFLLALTLAACQANSPATGQPAAGSPAPESAGSAAQATRTPTLAANEADAPTLLAQLTEANGEILARPDNASEFTTILLGHSIQAGGQVSTGLAASARLDLTDGSIIRMGPNSLFTLEPAEETETGRLARIRLDLGQIWVILNGQALDVDTPSGVASVRGSYLSVVAGREGVIYITCLEGDCSMTTEGGTVNLVAGQTAVVNGITKPPTPGTMEPEDVEDWLNANPEATVVLPQVTATVAAVAADPDRDFDGYPDSIDQCPLQGDVGNGVDATGCPLSFGEGDYDQDGVPNASDACPRRGDLGYGLDGRGCPLPPPDADGDGYPDARDKCPTQGDRGFGLDATGCPIPPPGADEDGDGVPNELDVCPNQGDKGYGVDSRGCPNGSPDSDGDGVPDTLDRCPNEGNRGFGVTQNGCPLPPPNGDFDKDGIPNSQDRCPLKGDAGYGIDNLGCPIIPPDTDKDGIPDADDACPRQGAMGCAQMAARNRRRILMGMAYLTQTTAAPRKAIRATA